jgi:hypothetical protein
MKRFRVIFKYGLAEMNFPSKIACIRFFILAGKKEDIINIIQIGE